MDALSLLRRDHRELKKVLAELEPTTDRAVRTRTRLFAELERELIAHETIEEELFYPALRARPSAAEMARAHERHGLVDDLVEPVRRIPVSDPTWLAHTRRMKDGLDSSAMPARIAASIASRSLPSATHCVCQPYARKRASTSSRENARSVLPSIVIELSS